MDDDLTPRPVSESEVMLVQQMTQLEANLLGNVHGGAIMKLVDNAGGPVVTASLDEMAFLEPVFVGDVVTVRASVNDVGHTSMEVGVRVDAENYLGSRKVHTSSGYLVYVALDQNGRPRPVPPVVAETPVQQQRQREAKLRREARLARAEAIKAARARADRASGG